jgi:hypothetical protein
MEGECWNEGSVREKASVPSKGGSNRRQSRRARLVTCLGLYFTATVIPL